MYVRCSVYRCCAKEANRRSAPPAQHRATVHRQEIALAENVFADQAVIAIENTRLFEAEQQRTQELTESLARQTATSEILRVISQSPTDARPVFDSIVLTAVRLLRCDLVFVLLCDGATFSPAPWPRRKARSRMSGPRIWPIDPNANFPSRDPRQKNAAPAGLVAHRATRARAHHP